MQVESAVEPVLGLADGTGETLVAQKLSSIDDSVPVSARAYRVGALRSNFEPVVRAGHQGIQRGHQKDADQKSREQATDDDQSERPLRIGADTGGQRCGQQSQRRYQRGHHVSKYEISVSFERINC